MIRAKTAGSVVFIPAIKNYINLGIKSYSNSIPHSSLITIKIAISSFETQWIMDLPDCYCNDRDPSTSLPQLHSKVHRSLCRQLHLLRIQLLLEACNPPDSPCNFSDRRPSSPTGKSVLSFYLVNCWNARRVEREILRKKMNYLALIFGLLFILFGFFFSRVKKLWSEGVEEDPYGFGYG